MVPIVNAMHEFGDRLNQTDQTDDWRTIEAELLQSLKFEADRCVNFAVDTILNEYQALQSTVPERDFVIGTFSRSFTLKLILERVLQKSTSIRIVCGQSTPGNEGELMASDIPNATWLSDNDFHRHIREGKLQLIIVGADCILSNDGGVVNKIGTKELAQTCKASNVPIICFADRWKLWDDIYSPPLEGIFEVVPRELLDDVVVPPCKG